MGIEDALPDSQLLCDTPLAIKEPTLFMLIEPDLREKLAELRLQMANVRKIMEDDERQKEEFQELEVQIKETLGTMIKQSDGVMCQLCLFQADEPGAMDAPDGNFSQELLDSCGRCGLLLCQNCRPLLCLVCAPGGISSDGSYRPRGDSCESCWPTRFLCCNGECSCDHCSPGNVHYQDEWGCRADMCDGCIDLRDLIGWEM